MLPMSMASRTRWGQINQLWESRAVQRRLEELKSVQKIEVVKYLAAEDLRSEDAGAQPIGKRTDIGAWLQQLFTKHGHEKNLRGIVVFSDGADNGTRFSSQEKAGLWRDCADPCFRRRRSQQSEIQEGHWPDQHRYQAEAGDRQIEDGDQRHRPAPGYENTKVDVSVWIEEVNEKNPWKANDIKNFEIKQAKDQPIRISCEAPEHAGEYKVTLKIAPQPDEANILNNEISTFIQVIKPRINILWVDRPRVYEPRFAIEALAKEERFKVHYVEPASDGKGDPFAIYKLDEQAYDVIVIGDISAQRFCQSKPEVFDRIKKMVANKTALLMLGGEETFANGDWHKQQAIMDLLPVKFDGPPAFSTKPLRVEPTPGAPRFLQLHADPKMNEKMWKEEFDPLDGIAALGSVVKDSTVLLGIDGDKKKPVMVATQSGRGGRVVVFASDATARCWYDTPEAVQAHHVFWKQLVGWLVGQEDNANELWIKLDKRRLSTDAADVLGFTFGLRGKSGDLLGAKFDAKIIGPKNQDFPVRFYREDQHQRGSFQGVKEPGEYKIVIEGIGKDGDKDVKAPGTARFLVADDNVEMLRPAAEHEMLVKIAVASDGRFSIASEAELLQLLDELRSQASRDARQKTIHWPDWQRLPPSDQVRDQLAGLWNSFAFVGFLLFVVLIGAEWTLRRIWGLI